VREIDGDENPGSEQGMVKDIRNIHICSAHQRAYVWVVTTPILDFHSVNYLKRTLWLMVYSLACWQSNSCINSEAIRKYENYQKLKKELEILEHEYRKLQTVVMPETQDKSKSVVHKNNKMQQMIDKVRQDSQERKNLLTAKKKDLKKLLSEIMEEWCLEPK
jgi:hypothetical protein